MLRVAITGTLSMPRKEAAALIDSTSNARFHPEVTCDTNYLVAALFDTGKARKAAKLGVTIISEAEMMQYIQAGAFPENKTPTKPPRVSNFPDISWTKRHSPGLPCYIEYEDNEALFTQQYVHVTCEGRGSNGNDYVGAYDREWFKTFRRDRLRKIEPI
jgi:hypothetical protein